MQIEKPKSSIPPLAIFLVLVAALFILSLPFMAKNGRTKTVVKPDYNASEAVLPEQPDHPGLLLGRHPGENARLLGRSAEFGVGQPVDIRAGEGAA